MQDSLRFLLEHPYQVLFAGVLVEQLGLPLPAVPWLLAAGALAGTDRIDPWLALGLALLACLLADLVWYEVGRRRGGKVLGLLCRISLEPDSCVRRTENIFARHGARTLLVAKFVPGLSTVAAPLAGMIGMRRSRFVLWDTGGALVWCGAYLGLGYVFADRLERVAQRLADLGGSLVAAAVVSLVLFVAWKYVQRRRFIRSLRIARITPEELRAKIESGADVVIVDLRHSLDFEAEPETIPGAVHMTTEELDARQAEIPHDREVVLYCT